MKGKIVICGGHVTPALAVLSEIQGAIDVVFIGRKYAFEGSRSVSAEYELITEKGIRFLPLTTGRLQRTFTVHTIPSLAKIPIGIFQSFWYLLVERPDLILSFGGYVALPVAIAGRLLGIPVITHEQTLSTGLANRIIEKLARRVCVAFPGVAGTYTGLPMRRELFKPHGDPFSIDARKSPLLYITGGSTGAQTLNECMYPIIGKLTKTYIVIHQVGKSAVKGVAGSNRYIVREFLSVSELAWVLRHAKIVIGRSGANTTLELAALGKVAILVPLPWSAGNEQLLQARWLAAHGGSVVMEQREMTPEKLLLRLTDVEKNYDSLDGKAQRFSKEIPRNGAVNLVRIMATYLS